MTTAADACSVLALNGDKTTTHTRDGGPRHSGKRNRRPEDFGSSINHGEIDVERGYTYVDFAAVGENQLEVILNMTEAGFVLKNCLPH